DLILAAAEAVHGAPVARRRTAEGDLAPIDLGGRWPVIPVHAAVSDATGTTLTPDTPLPEVLGLCRRSGVVMGPTATAGEAVVELYEALVEPRTIAPTVFCDFP